MPFKLNFSLTQLEYVLAVQKYGHFRKAAAACFVTQPTLSMQIQKLEEILGTIIFDRSKKPILLTATGQKLVEQMQSIVHEAKKLGGIIEMSQSGALEGKLTVGVIPTVAPYLIPKLLPVIEKLHPLVKLTIFEMQTDKLIEALGDDSVDVGILATPLETTNMFERHLYLEPFSVLCRRDHPLAKQKRVKYSSLSSSDVWLLEEGHCLRNQVLDICTSMRKKEVEPKYQFESGSLETLKRLVDSFGGYTLLPYLAKDALGPNVKIIEFEQPIPARQIGLVSRRNQYKVNLIDGLESAILKALPEALRKLKTKDLDVLAIS